MGRDEVMAWVARYERAWRQNDVGAVAELFTELARYAPSPYDEPEVGHAAIEAFWPEEGGTRFTMSADPVAVEGRSAVVRVRVHYSAPREQEYQDLWVLRFADDGRVEDFEEWAHWPGRPYRAAQEQGAAGPA
ncbi:hypothetical protein GCM10009809_25820 [Isoptericola hypogeus]|uniref:SnoaL-like domain-containing protein n=1 Tax=Isoptericola hypogeus TaxID=300179 RepID=A0ABN2JJ67_9MICO